MAWVGNTGTPPQHGRVVPGVKPSRPPHHGLGRNAGTPIPVISGVRPPPSPWPGLEHRNLTPDPGAPGGNVTSPAPRPGMGTPGPPPLLLPPPGDTGNETPLSFLPRCLGWNIEPLPHPGATGSETGGKGGGDGSNGVVPVYPQPPTAAGHGLGLAVPRLLPPPGRRDPPRCPPGATPPSGVRRCGLRLWGAAG